METIVENIKFVLGDWSNDGHGKVETYIVKVNCSFDELRQSYRKSVAKFKIDPKNEILCDGCDNIMDTEVVKIFKDAGYSFKDEYKNEYGYTFDTDEYINFILWFITQSNSDLKYAFVDDIPVFDIGGYGLVGD